MLSLHCNVCFSLDFPLVFMLLCASSCFHLLCRITFLVLVLHFYYTSFFAHFFFCYIFYVCCTLFFAHFNFATILFSIVVNAQFFYSTLGYLIYLFLNLIFFPLLCRLFLFISFLMLFVFVCAWVGVAFYFLCSFFHFQPFYFLQFVWRWIAWFLKIFHNFSFDYI